MPKASRIDVELNRRCALARARMRFRILEALAFLGHSPKTIAVEAGVTLPSVSRVINGGGNSPTVLNKLREVGVPEKLLFDPRRKKEKGRV